jgi:hypothetical protein
MCVSVACVPLMALIWIQFSDDEPNLPPDAALKHIAAGQKVGFTDGTDAQNLNGTPSTGIIQASGSNEPQNAVVFATDEPEDPDAAMRRLAQGEWEDEYQGRRFLTVSPDGAGKMVVELEGIGKRIFAPSLSFDLNWSVADGVVTLTTLGGEPASKVKVILKIYGSEAQYKVLELTADRMLLLDGDGKTQYDWRRPKSSAKSSPTATKSP